MIRIAHTADIQIRAFKRHDEFKRHFENFYQSLRENRIEHLVLAGDLFHDKSKLSPDSIDLFVDFLQKLSSICELYIIAGNHDAILSNPSKVDSIGPIVKAINNPRIHYFKHSGIYNFKDFNFVVFSCLDSEDKWPLAEQIDKNKINIGLFHGAFNGAILSNGYVMENAYKLNEFLQKVDYLMCGDIHQMQYIGELEYQYKDVDDNEINIYKENGWQVC